MANQILGQDHYAGVIPVVILPWFPAGSKLHITPSPLADPGGHDPATTHALHYCAMGFSAAPPS